MSPARQGCFISLLGWRDAAVPAHEGLCEPLSWAMAQAIAAAGSAGLVLRRTDRTYSDATIAKGSASTRQCAIGVAMMLASRVARQHVSSTEIEVSAVCLPKAVGGPIITNSITAVSPLSSTLQSKFPKTSLPSPSVQKDASSPRSTAKPGQVWRAWHLRLTIMILAGVCRS
ncbi:hypothetical protein SNOG_08197 [Parastagonospora nodorum SN15]|uniref:Uncharacterized protein n=1 Tax=Phaeosphaeria nodorum (strain SN15 / ATCC MYA-4574 / FGSC 10173) TaxID=321614 RepID=Q0UJ67_PHANO|nr:hypothetical protein SNOG_08197 [Parastagonospora nodorum SN15]EAT84473.1 hypothetical protein SNOG_08197 [Parastagonospora nodorum SN15]